MHELSLALSLLDIASEESARLGHPRVRAIHIQLGPLSGVVETALLHAFEIAREGSSFASTSLAIEPVPILAYCPHCACERPVESIQSIRCTLCHTPTPRILQGREFQIVALEIEDQP